MKNQYTQIPLHARLGGRSSKNAKNDRKIV